jgi:hypothetical protein
VVPVWIRLHPMVLLETMMVLDIDLVTADTRRGVQMRALDTIVQSQMEEKEDL